MLVTILGVLIGFYLIFCSVKNYDWFFEGRRIRNITKLFGRKGARIFYGIAGIMVILTVVFTF